MDTGALLQNLKTIEPTVKLLLSRKRPSALVREKIQQFEFLVAMIPDEEEILVTNWRERLAQSWLLYDEILHQNGLSGSMFEQDFSSFKEQVNCGSLSTNNDESKSMAITISNKHSDPESCQVETFTVVDTTQSPVSFIPTERQSYKYLDTTSDPFVDDECDLEDSLSLEVEKDSVYRQLEVDFEKLFPVKTSKDIEAIEALEKLVARAELDIAHFSQTTKIKRQIMIWATSKLTEDQKGTFQKLTKNEQSTLSTLTSYLANLKKSCKSSSKNSEPDLTCKHCKKE